MQHPRCSTSAVELVFIKIVGIDSTLTTLLKIFPSKNFSCNYIKIFSALLLKYLTGAPFLIKLLAVHYSATGHNFTKTLTDRRIFLKLFFLRQLIFGAYSEENLCLSLLIVKLLSLHCSLTTLVASLFVLKN